ncbi:MAG: malonyl-ACP O-methyltransferase BioC [Gammaproteobacteria bacterium]|nr:malonyl-ACP O-methyltransferase BioC [Gammaproteobacteria bacterium]
MSEEDAYRIDKQQVKQAFDGSAARYDEVAVLQRQVGDRLLDRLRDIRFEPERILDIGCGTGENSKGLLKFYPSARVITADLSTGMLEQARLKGSRLHRWRGRQTFLAADMEALPLADASVDMVFSNLTVQWCQDLERVFRECRRVLKPGGMLMFTTLGPDTLNELRQSWQQADGFVHVNAFMDMHDIGDAMVRSQLAEPVMDVEYFRLTYQEVGGLMRDLKVLGAHNINSGRAHGLTGKGRFMRMREAYEGFRSDGVLPATYEVVYGHAWAPEQGLMQQREGETTSIPLSQVRLATRGSSS